METQKVTDDESDLEDVEMDIEDVDGGRVHQMFKNGGDTVVTVVTRNVKVLQGIPCYCAGYYFIDTTNVNEISQLVCYYFCFHLLMKTKAYNSSFQN